MFDKNMDLDFVSSDEDEDAGKTRDELWTVTLRSLMRGGGSWNMLPIAFWFGCELCAKTGL